MKGRISLATALSSWLLLISSVSEAAPASTNGATYQQPDGSETPELYLNGDERYAWLSDINGYTVMRDTNSSWYVYARKNEDGNLESANARVGMVNPTKLGLEPQLIHDYAAAASFRDEEEEDKADDRHFRRLLKSGGRICKHEATALDPCYLKQLALLVQFDDHKHRKLPDPEEMDILFNHNGPTGEGTASTGSISDVYRQNSFDTFVMDTHVTPWIQVSCTEKYASQGRNGFNLKETRECWAEALQKYAATLADNGLDQYDDDGDGFFDGITIVHSGVAAENNGLDCESAAPFNNRIWSHAVAKAPNNEFLGENDIDLGIKVGRFYVFSGLYNNCPTGGPWTQWATGRISVGVHEGGHFLGLPDLYGKPGKDNGIGNWGFMGNMYGWDVSQNWPGLMSAYSRHLLEWVEVVDVTYSQEIGITASCDSDKVYRIPHRMASDPGGEEYLLLENRYACGHDLKLLYREEDRQGIAVWYVDHTMIQGQNAGKDVIRYNTNKPPSNAAWPMVHNRVSLLQGDGLFEMETNKNRGDHKDMFRKDSGKLQAQRAFKISNAGITMNDRTTKKYPNTNSIAHGDERDSGITIEILDNPEYKMRVKITLLDTDGNEVTKPPPGNSGTQLENQGQGQGQQDDQGKNQGQGQQDNQGENQGQGQQEPEDEVQTGGDEPDASEGNDPDLQFGLLDEGAKSGELGANSITTIGNGASIFGNNYKLEGNNKKDNAANNNDESESKNSDNASDNSASDNSDTSGPGKSGGTKNGETSSGGSASEPKQHTLAPESNGSMANSNASPNGEANAQINEPSPTEAPTSAPEEDDTSEYECNNTPADNFKFTGHGNEPSMTKIRQCQFINPDKREPEEWCNLVDMGTNEKVYKKCQIQCHHITGCSPP